MTTKMKYRADLNYSIVGPKTECILYHVTHFQGITGLKYSSFFCILNSLIPVLQLWPFYFL